MNKDNFNWNDRDKAQPKKRPKKDRLDRLKERLRPKPVETPLGKETINMCRLNGIPVVGFSRDKTSFVPKFRADRSSNRSY